MMPGDSKTWIPLGEIKKSPLPQATCPDEKLKASCALSQSLILTNPLVRPESATTGIDTNDRDRIRMAANI